MAKRNRTSLRRLQGRAGVSEARVPPGLPHKGERTRRSLARWAPCEVRQQRVAPRGAFTGEIFPGARWRGPEPHSCPVVTCRREAARPGGLPEGLRSWSFPRHQRGEFGWELGPFIRVTSTELLLRASSSPGSCAVPPSHPEPSRTQGAAEADVPCPSCARAQSSRHWPRQPARPP